MLNNVIVLKGCLEGHGKYYSYHVHIKVTGFPETVLYSCESFFKTEFDCEHHMKENLPMVAKFVSDTLPHLMLDPSKFVDLDVMMPSQLTRKDLH